ncbi:DUF6634 family protein [Gymnodinialimonas ulvae]|uniref:DUF6634 family protein n=1 Tax=Gymnodinialimonas ulvae TaxID=3126504 RepID=UPI0030A46D40
MDPNERDLDLLQRLRSVRPLCAEGHDDDTVVSWDDLERGLQETFLTVAPEFEPTRIDGGLYVTAFEWVFAYEDIWRLITTRMRLRSLELAVTGPTAAELDCAPFLAGWVSVRSDGDTGAHLVGDVDAHPASIGPMIHTSPLCGIDPDAGWARTVSRWYRLGDRSTPTEFYRRWGKKAEGISAIAIETWEAQAICVAEQIEEGFRGA